MSTLDPDDTVAMNGGEMKELLQEAFEAGEQAQRDAYWGSDWVDFDEWFTDLEWGES